MNSLPPSIDEHDRFHNEDAEDIVLMHRCQQGCNECFNLLFHRYCKLVFAIAWKILRQDHEADDIVQEVFLTIFLQRDRFDVSRGTVRTWFAQFAHFKALMRRRYLNTRQLTDLEELCAFESAAARADSLRSVTERATLVEQCLAILKPRQRRIIKLIHFDGYTLAEAAALLPESLANTRNLYYRGIKALQSHLASPPFIHLDSPAKMVEGALNRVTDPLILRTGL